LYVLKALLAMPHEVESIIEGFKSTKKREEKEL